MRKLMIGLTGVIVLILLAATESLYVEGPELLIIIGGIMAAVTIGVVKSSTYTEAGKLGIAAVLGFVLCMMTGSLDIMIDHYMYFSSAENTDGALLSIGFKLEEFNDDLFIVSVISMLSVLLSSFILHRLFLNSSSQNI
jgi:hypothetical protein